MHFGFRWPPTVLRRSGIRRTLAAAAIALAGVFLAAPARALEPDEVLILARAASPEAKTLADRYRKRRGIPAGNVLGLQVAARETIDREEFDRWVLKPLRADLARPERSRIRCLVTLLGLPLRVAAAPGTLGVPDSPAMAERRATTVASFDSEVALALLPGIPLEGWAPNPLLLRPGGALASDGSGGRALMVARLDGPSLEAASALVDRALEGERLGLDGVFCFDARGFGADGAYGGYDERIRAAARVAEAAGLRVRLENTEDLFAPGSCSGTAFYIGWYKLGSYVDSFGFAPGAVGFHVASVEASSLRYGNGWVKGLLDHGITATLGPTDEPYLQSFPDPVAFLQGVLEGDRTLAEIYWRTVPHTSWRQVLVGDPLYRPRVIRPGGK